MRLTDRDKANRAAHGWTTPEERKRAERAEALRRERAEAQARRQQREQAKGNPLLDWDEP